MRHVGRPSRGKNGIGRFPGAITGHQDRHEIRCQTMGRSLASPVAGSAFQSLLPLAEVQEVGGIRLGNALKGSDPFHAGLAQSQLWAVLNK